MKKKVLILFLTIVLFTVPAGCRNVSKGKQGMEQAEEDAPRISANTVQTAVTGLMMEARVGQLDAAYDEVDTRDEVIKVTAGEGQYSLIDYLQASYPLNPAFDISLTGKVTVD